MRDPADIQLRGGILLLFVLLGMLVLEARLFHLQVIDQSGWAKRSLNNQVRRMDTLPHRGLILDREGRVLVDNRPSYTVTGVPAILLADSAVVFRLADLCERDSGRIFRRLSRAGRYTQKPVKLLSDLSFELRARLAEFRLDYPGVDVRVEGKRHYDHHVAPHVLGYVKEVSEKDLSQPSFQDREPGDLIGRKGLERFYDAEMAGQAGLKYLTVDSRGRILGPTEGMDDLKPVHGHDLELSIDLDLQLVAESLIQGHRGAVILMECKTGEILAAASQPDYQLEHFSGRMPPDVWAGLNNAETRPLLNRMVQGQYPPGSLFKVAMAAYAIEHNIVDETWTVTCDGAMQLGRRTARCWKEEGHGPMVMRQAIQHSCDIWFYQLGLKLQPDDIAEVGKLFRMTDPTGVDLTGEYVGLIPNNAWFDEHLGVRGWTRGVMLNLAIGQGEVLLTPLQLARHAASLANGGERPVPHFGRALIDRISLERVPFQWPTDHIDLSDRAWQMIRTSTKAVVEDLGGTAHAQRREAYQSAGKTGTSENPHGDHHSIYMGWMPLPNPEVVAVAYLENAGHGSAVAAPMAFNLFDAWYDLQNAEAAPHDSMALSQKDAAWDAVKNTARDAALEESVQ
jgi:penicillin-binding protein 2